MTPGAVAPASARATIGHALASTLVIATISAAGVLGAGAAGAATAVHGRLAVRSAAPASRLTWHKLSLIHGWQSAEASFHTGSPAWAISNGVVYLAGSIKQPSGKLNTFAQLPLAARPAHWVYRGVSTFGGAYGQLTIQANGQMWVNNSLNVSPKDYTSLAGVSFPAAHTAVHKLSLASGWKPDHPVDDAGPVTYSLADGVVLLSGVVREPVSSNLLLTVLPKRARPAQVLYLTVITENWEPGVLRIAPNGDVYAYGGGKATFFSLGGVSFPVTKTGWHSLGLLNGWISEQSADHTGVPSCRVSGSVVYLSGAIRQGASGNGLFATLPPGARPARNLYIETYTISGTVGWLHIQRDGDMWATGSPQSNANVFTSLATISFPVGS